MKRDVTLARHEDPLKSKLDKQMRQSRTKSRLWEQRDFPSSSMSSSSTDETVRSHTHASTHPLNGTKGSEQAKMVTHKEGKHRADRRGLFPRALCTTFFPPNPQKNTSDLRQTASSHTQPQTSSELSTVFHCAEGTPKFVCVRHSLGQPERCADGVID